MKQLRNKQSGFTLIEVVLVLAIGALIILMAVLAFGGASRSRRDTARTSLAGTIQASVEQAASNTGGTYPTAAEFTTLASNNKWADPSSGTAGVVAGTAAQSSAGIVYVSGGSCDADGKKLATTSGGTGYAVIYYQETTKSTVCKSN